MLKTKKKVPTVPKVEWVMSGRLTQEVIAFISYMEFLVKSRETREFGAFQMS